MEDVQKFFEKIVTCASIVKNIVNIEDVGQQLNN